MVGYQSLHQEVSFDYNPIFHHSMTKKVGGGGGGGSLNILVLDNSIIIYVATPKYFSLTTIRFMML